MTDGDDEEKENITGGDWYMGLCVKTFDFLFLLFCFEW
jgi:hypothetical protein